MAWTRIAFSGDYIDAADRLAAFLTRANQPGTVTPGVGNTGDGIVFGLSSTADSVAEDFTLTCTTAGAAAEFSVVGSVTGAIGTATVNVPFSSDVVCFTIVGGDTNFALTDAFTFSIASGTPNWSEMRNETRRDLATGKEYVFKGIGGGTDEIYVGIRTLTNGTTYYNWDLQGFTGYVEASNFELLPGYQAGLYTSFPTTGSMVLWIWESARRIIVIPVPTGDYHGQIHLGWLQPTATPSQWDNPLFIGGDSNTSDSVYTGSRSAWWKTKANSKQYDGSVWDLNSQAWPYIYYTPVKDVNGNFPLKPVTIVNAESTGRKIYGEVEGCFAVAGEGGAIGTTDFIVTPNKEFFIITKNVSIVGSANIMAIKLT